MGDSQKEIKNYGFLIEKTMKRIRQHLQKKFNEAEADLTVDQWVVLDILQKEPDMSQSQIAASTLKDAPTITRIIDLLCKKELTERLPNPDDRRKFRVVLTESGRTKIDDVMPLVTDMRLRGWQHLSDQQYRQLIDILNTVYQNFEEE